MLEIKATPEEFDNWWKNEINCVFKELEEEIENLDLSGKTIDHLECLVAKGMNILYKRLDEKFTNVWKYYGRENGNGKIEQNITGITITDSYGNVTKIGQYEEPKKIQNIKLDSEECIEYYEDGIKKHLNTNKKDKMYVKVLNEIIDYINELEK